MNKVRRAIHKITEAHRHMQYTWTWGKWNLEIKMKKGEVIKNIILYKLLLISYNCKDFHFAKQHFWLYLYPAVYIMYYHCYWRSLSLLCGIQIFTRTGGSQENSACKYSVIVNFIYLIEVSLFPDCSPNVESELYLLLGTEQFLMLLLHTTCSTAEPWGGFYCEAATGNAMYMWSLKGKKNPKILTFSAFLF